MSVAQWEFQPITREDIDRYLTKALDELGMVIIPREPTEKMIDAGVAAMGAWHDLPGSALTVNREKMRRRYQAMIEAADSLPSESISER